MQLNYTITQEHYEDVIAFQLKLQRSKRRSLIQYIVTNAIFIILAVYFLVTHPESSVWSRLGVMGMAAAMLVLTTDRRSCSPGKVRRTYKRYVRLKLIQDGFIGPHTLLVDKNSVTQKFGDQSNTIEIKRCAWVNGENRISMILGGGVIFEIIPNEVLDQNGNRERLSALIAGHDADETASGLTETIFISLERDQNILLFVHARSLLWKKIVFVGVFSDAPGSAKIVPSLPCCLHRMRNSMRLQVGMKKS